MPLERDKKKKRKQPLNLNASDWLVSNNYKRLRDNRKNEILRPTSSNRNCLRRNSSRSKLIIREKVL